MQSQLVGVHHIEASKSAFAAIKVQAGVDACVPGVAGVAGVQVKLKSGVVTWEIKLMEVTVVMCKIVFRTSCS